MHRDFFEKFLDMKLYQGDIETVIDDKKFFLAHGDGLVKNDYGYLILKKIFRNKLMQKIYSWIHPNLGIKIASGMSKTSRDYTGDKDYGEEDGMFEFAKSKIDDGYDFVILGHSHKKEFKDYKNGYYINLGTWLSEPSYGVFSNGEFKMIDWK
jgi:UDP-2,3-diacylglucosamine hydrolase